MLQITHIKLKPKDCILLINYLGIQFTPQLFSTVSLPTTLGRLALPKVTSANCHHNKYEVNNPKVVSLSLTFYLQSSLPCLVDVANQTYQNRTKGFYIPPKVSGYSVYTSTFFNGFVPNQVR